MFAVFNCGKCALLALCSLPSGRRLFESNLSSDSTLRATLEMQRLYRLEFEQAPGRCGASVSPSLTVRAFSFAYIELLAHPAHLRGSWMVGLLAGLDHIMVGGLMTARRLAYSGGSSYARPPILLTVA